MRSASLALGSRLASDYLYHSALPTPWPWQASDASNYLSGANRRAVPKLHPCGCQVDFRSPGPYLDLWRFGLGPATPLGRMSRIEACATVWYSMT
jgi:hypothetical protein